jgi:hypothetical protein
MMSTAFDIFVNGDPEPVAPSIARHGDYVFSPLHTHASSGMIHIEASRNQRFTLGMLFTEWGVRLTTDCVGGYCRPGTPVSAYVNGDRTSEPMPDIVFRKGEEIALVIGSPPSTIPSNWDCRAKISPIENPRRLQTVRPMTLHARVLPTASDIRAGSLHGPARKPVARPKLERRARPPSDRRHTPLCFDES